MKNKLILLIISILFQACGSISAKAQEKQMRHEYSLGYGNWSGVQLIEGVYSGKEGYSSRPIKNHFGPASVRYKYLLSPRISIGVNLTYENDNGWIADKVAVTNNGVVTANVGIFKRHVITMAPELLIHYNREKNNSIGSYGYLDIGISYLFETDYYDGLTRLGNNRKISYNKSQVGFQICPIGIYVGSKIRCFAELGFGYKGIINGGLSLRL